GGRTGARFRPRRACSQLPVVVQAPAVPAAVGGAGAGVLRTHVECRERQSPRDGHGRPAAGAVGARVRRGIDADPELPRRIVTPAVGRPARGEAAGVEVARAERREREPTRDREGRVAARAKAATLDVARVGPDTESAVQIVPPAIGGAIRRHRTGRPPAGAQRRERQSPGDSEGRRTARELSYVRTAAYVGSGRACT